MKRILLAMVLLAGLAAHAVAQAPVILTNPADWGPWKAMTTTAGNNQKCVDLSGHVYNDHTFIYQPNNGPSGITVTITGYRAGAVSTVTTGTTTTGGSIHFTGAYNSLCFTVTALTGAGASVDGGYQGANGASAASGSVSITGDTTVIQPDGDNLHVDVDNCTGCGGGTQDTDDGTVAGGQSGQIVIGATYVWNGSNWVRLLGNATDGALVNLGANNDVVAAATEADGANVTLGAKADAKNAATDTTAITLMQVEKQQSEYLKQITAGTATASVTDPCDGLDKTYYKVNMATASTVVFAAASASNKIRICSILLQVSADVNIAIVEDATGSCASPDAGIVGGTTTDTGLHFVANQGYAQGSGTGTILKSASTNVNGCLITSATSQVTGGITYTLAP